MSFSTARALKALSLIVMVFAMAQHGMATDFSGKTVAGGYQAANLSNDDFQNCSLIGGSNGFQLTNFSDSNFQNAQLLATGTSSWQGADFQSADFQDAQIVCSGISSWQGADFADANLEGATFKSLGESSFQDADFKGAQIDSSTIFWDGQNYQTTSFDWQQAGIVLVSATPEPSSWALGLLCVGFFEILRARAARRKV